MYFIQYKLPVMYVNFSTKFREILSNIEQIF